MSSSGSEATKSKYFIASGKKNGNPVRPATSPVTRSQSGATPTASANTSTNTSLNEQSVILSELEEIKRAIKCTVKTDDLKEIVSTMVREIMKEQKEDFEKQLKEVERRNKTERGKLKDEIDKLSIENNRLLDLIAEKRSDLEETKKMAMSAERKAEEAKVWANYNEQYSRKNNVKFYGVREEKDEDTEGTVIDLLRSEASTNVEPKDIIAVHRIPGKRADQPKPILLKLKNSDIKARVIRQRAVFKEARIGIRIADDVTYENTKLLERLNEHEMIESSWYYNGSVYGKVHGSGRKIKFRICDDITERIRKTGKK